MLRVVKGYAKAAVEQARLMAITPNGIDVSRLAQLPKDFVPRAMQSNEAAQAWAEAARKAVRAGLPDGTGGVNPGDRRAIFHVVHALRPSRVLEVGTHIGASTIHIALALEALGQGTVTTVDVVDVNDPRKRPWEAFGSPASPRSLVTSLGLDHRVRFETGRSVDFLRNGGEDYDLIFLDGDHGALTVARELPLALERLAPEGAILLHDYFPGLRPLWPGLGIIPGPYLATEWLRAHGANLHVVPLGELPWPTKAGSHRTSLAMVSAG